MSKESKLFKESKDTFYFRLKEAVKELRFALQYRLVYRLKRLNKRKNRDRYTILGKLYLGWFNVLKAYLDGLYEGMVSGRIEMIPLSDRVVVPCFIVDEVWLARYFKDRKVSKHDLHWYNLEHYCHKAIKDMDELDIKVVAAYLSTLLLISSKDEVYLPSKIEKLKQVLDDEDLYVIEKQIESNKINLDDFRYTWNAYFNRTINEFKNVYIA